MVYPRPTLESLKAELDALRAEYNEFRSMVLQELFVEAMSSNDKKLGKSKTRTARKTKKARRGGQRANASTCPPGQHATNLKNWGGNCGPFNSSYKLMTGQSLTN